MVRLTNVHVGRGLRHHRRGSYAGSGLLMVGPRLACCWGTFRLFPASHPASQQMLPRRYRVMAANRLSQTAASGNQPLGTMTSTSDSFAGGSLGDSFGFVAFNCGHIVLPAQSVANRLVVMFATTVDGSYGPQETTTTRLWTLDALVSDKPHDTVCSAHRIDALCFYLHGLHLVVNESITHKILDRSFDVRPRTFDPKNL